MSITDFGYCGLNCTTCQEKFADIRGKINALDVAFDKVNIQGMVNAIPFMSPKYRGYLKFTRFFKAECPGCRNNGGNPFCSIRKCAKKKQLVTCVDCEADMCRKFKTILNVHTDSEVQRNREIIKNMDDR